MKSLDDVQKAVKRFRDHNRSRESSRLNELFDLVNVDKALVMLTEVQAAETPNTENVLAALTQVTAALDTFGKKRERSFVDETADLETLNKIVGEIRKSATGLLVDLGTSVNPRETGRLMGTTMRIQSAIRRRIDAINDISNMRTPRH